MCLLPLNLVKYLVLLVDEHSKRKVSPSDKQSWQFFEKHLRYREIVVLQPFRLVAILKFILLLITSAVNAKILTFVSLKVYFLNLV